MRRTLFALVVLVALAGCDGNASDGQTAATTTATTAVVRTVTVPDPEGEAAKDGCRLFVNCAAYLLGAGFPDSWNSYTCKDLPPAALAFPIRFGTRPIYTMPMATVSRATNERHHP
jgi:hypothetical protein